MFILGKSYAKPGNKVIVTNGELERWDMYYRFGGRASYNTMCLILGAISLSSTSSSPSFSPSSTSWSWEAGSLTSEFVNLPAWLFCNPSFDWSHYVFKTNVWEKELSFLYSLLWRPLLLSRGEELASGGLGAGKVVISYQTGLLRWGDDCYVWKLIL